MNKVISVAAILALSTASVNLEASNDEFFKLPKPKIDIGVHFDEAADDELVQKPASRVMQFDSVDEELFKIPMPKVDIGVHFDEAADDELNAKDVFKKIGNGLLTGLNVVGKLLDDEVADQELFKIPKPKVDIGVHFDETADQELFKLPKPKVDIGVHFDENADDELFQKPASRVMQFDSVDEELFKIPMPKVDVGIHFDEAADAELNAKDVFKKIGNGILTGLNVVGKLLDDEVADGELFKIPKPKVDIGVHFDENADDELFQKPASRVVQFDSVDEELFKIPMPKVDVGIHFDEAADDELNAKDVFKKIGNGILTGLNVVGKLLDDEVADGELFQKPASRVMQFDSTDDELFKIPMPKVDIGIHFDENAENEFFAQRQNQTQHHQAVKKAQREVKNTSELLRKIHSQKERRNGPHQDSLSNLGQLLHEGHQIRNHTVSAKPVKNEQVHRHNLRNIKDKLKQFA